MGAIELKAEEKALVARIDFKPESLEEHAPGHWNVVGDASLRLMKSLVARKAIPEVRTRYFTDPAFNIGGRGRSRAQIFQKNGTRGDAVFRHPHFLKYLHYFLYGPDLPPRVIEGFRQRISDVGWVTSSDIVPLGNYARQLARSHTLHGRDVAEEFFKLGLDCGLDVSDARCVYDEVRKVR